MSKICIKKGGVTKLGCDAVVNAANEGLWAGSGVCGAIFKEAGLAKLQAACNKIGGCPTGSAVITPAFDLNAKYIIHAVGPIWQGGNANEAKKLYGCYKRSLELARENNCHSIAFPLISSGIYGYPKDGAWRKAIQACLDFMANNEDYDIDIYFAILDDMIKRMGEDILSDLQNSQTIIPKSNTEKPMRPKEADEKIPPKDMLKPVSREDRIRVFNDTQDWIRSDQLLANSVLQAKKKTQVFFEDDYPGFDMSGTVETKIHVTGEKSFQAAMRLHKEDNSSKIAVMNFANAFHAGGGVTKGSAAQEESLCRCSTLYPLIYRRSLRDTFYAHHKKLNTAKASDALIYTEGVIICKTDDDIPIRMPKEDWVEVDVITIAAPDLRTKSNMHASLVGNGTYMNDAELFGYHVKRAIHMLTVAAAKGADTLVLGAFGCGAFNNDPEVVAKAYKTALEVFPKVFRRIEFAVYCTPQSGKNYEVFKRVIMGE